MAPRDLRPRLLELIEQETRLGPEGRITFKANSIGDAGMIEALYDASRAGVQIDLVVRGISCLRAGVAGAVGEHPGAQRAGRYLEHSRIYRFGHGDVDDTPLYLIGSADIMPRNLDRRVEVLVPIEHPKHRDWLDQCSSSCSPTTSSAGSCSPTTAGPRMGPLDVFEPHAQERLYRWVVERQATTRK